ncbi:MAG: hypothetical protein ACOVMR_06870 [Flavobacteriales bacterium]
MKYFTTLVFSVIVAFGMNAQSSRDQKFMDSLSGYEQRISSFFLEKREFHLDLSGQLPDMNQAPYDSLDFLFWEMKKMADASIITRKFCAESKNILNESELLSSLKLKQDSAQNFSNSYNRICARNEIVRLEIWKLVEYTSNQLIQWQDSMDFQGTIIAQSRIVLNLKFSDKKSPEYMQRYKPLSNMEAAHKRYQSIVIQLENSLTRFEGSNTEAFFYKGPLIKTRIELEALEQTIMQLRLEMAAFREIQNQFLAALN